jgi:DNA-binding CsgD family transcriptional regulator
MKITRLHVVGMVAVLALAGAGAAFAVSRSSEQRCADEQGHSGRAFHHQHRGAVREAFAASAGYLGLSRSELLSRLREGKSLAQIAEAQGKSVEGLKQAIRGAIVARLDSAVASGRLTEAKKQRLLERLDAVIDDLVQRARAGRT